MISAIAFSCYFGKSVVFSFSKVGKSVKNTLKIILKQCECYLTTAYMCESLSSV